MQKNKKVILVYGLLALFILGATLLPGYIQTFDMAWGPHLPTPDVTNNTWLLIKTINVLSLIVPGWLVQKVILMSLIMLAGLGAHKLVCTNSFVSSLKLLPYFAGLLYVFNPFFYTRLMAGQWQILLGYALLPWAIVSIYKFLQKPSWATCWPVVLWMAAIGLTSIHTLAIASLAGLGLLIAAGKQSLPLKFKWGSVAVAAWIVLSSFWLVPILSGQSQTVQNISNFDSRQTLAFATNDTVLGSVPISAALLTGFWADDQNRYQLPSQLPIWWVGVSIVMGLVIAGVIAVFKRRERLGITLLALGFVAWLLGIGAAWFITKPLTDLLTQIVPFYAGYREPQKWLMLLALSYAYLAAVGAAVILQKIYQTKFNKYAYLAAGVIVISPFLYAPNLAFGGGGQLKSANYPQQWAEAKRYLDTQAGSTDVLVLPWHMYLPVSFTGRVVANPAPYYFNQPLVISDDAELIGLQPKNRIAVNRYIDEELIPLSINHQKVGQKLQQRNIGYVLLLKEADWQRYGWLHNQTDLPRVLNNDKLQIYKVDTP